MSDNVIPLFRDDDDAADEYAVGFAIDHIRKGFYDDDDLRIAGCTRAEAEEYYRSRWPS